VSAVEVLLELRARNIAVDAVDGKIRCRHRPGALPPELAARVRARRAEVLALLADPEALREAAARAIFGAEADDDGRRSAVDAGSPDPRHCFACGGARFAPDDVCLVCHPRPGVGGNGGSR